MSDEDRTHDVDAPSEEQTEAMRLFLVYYGRDPINWIDHIRYLLRKRGYTGRSCSCQLEGGGTELWIDTGWDQL